MATFENAPKNVETRNTGLQPGPNVVGGGGTTILNALTGGGKGHNVLNFDGMGGLFGKGSGNNDPFEMMKFLMQSQMGPNAGNPGGNSSSGGSRGGIMGSTGEMQDILGRGKQRMDQFNPAGGNFDKIFNWGGAGQDYWGSDGNDPMSMLQGRMQTDLGYGGFGAGESPLLNNTAYRNNLESQKDYRDPQQVLDYARQVEGEGYRPDMDAYTQAGRDIAGRSNMAGDLAPLYEQGQNLEAMGGQYGRRQSEQVAGLQNQGEQDLLRGIDTEAGNTLAQELPEVQAAMEAAGVGRSGSSGFAGGQLAGDIMGQANRDKQRTMAQFADQNMARQAQAFGLEAQLGAGSADQRMGMLGNLTSQQMGMMGQESLQNLSGQYGLAGQGLNDMMSSAENTRNRMGNLLGQQYGQSAQLGQMDQDRLMNAGAQGEQFRLGAMGQQDQMQGDALSQMMGMYGMRNDMQNSAEDRVLGQSEHLRGIDQNMLSGMMGMGMMPMDLMMRLATGTSGSGFTPTSGGGGGGNPFLGQAAGLGGNALAGLLNGGQGSGYNAFTG